MFRLIPHRLLIEPKASVVGVEDAGARATAALHIDGLVCSACAARVQRRLARIDGVACATVDVESGGAVVDYDPARASPAQLLAAAEGAVLLPALRRILARRFGCKTPQIATHA